MYIETGCILNPIFETKYNGVEVGDDGHIILDLIQKILDRDLRSRMRCFRDNRKDGGVGRGSDKV